MNYNREPCRPIYTQQQATSSLKAYNLAFKRTAQYNNNNKTLKAYNLAFKRTAQYNNNKKAL